MVGDVTFTQQYGTKQKSEETNMTHVATMGTSSCATIAIGGFKGEVAMAINEAYKDTKEITTDTNRSDYSVNQFYSKVLYPTDQQLGRSMDMPFTKLMEDIDNSSMSTKLIIATLNEYQVEHKNKYWPTELAKFGFELVDKTKNTIGQMCYVYIRSNNRPHGIKIGQLT